MKTRMKSPFFLIAAVAFLCAGAGLRAEAQPQSDSLRKAYDFKGAVEWCEWQLKRADSTQRGALEAELILSQNGLSMTQYCSSPTVVTRRRFRLDDFFLFYPMEEGAWRSLPNPLDSLAGGGEAFVRAMFVPDDATRLYFSARGTDGVRNLFHSVLRDSVWSLPSLLGEELTSPADEIYPIVSRDGKTLHFASRGLYGMGGYDLYVARWNDGTREWDPPVNLGFPYSSPYDDFLFVNSDDGQYSLFASNRACPGTDSVDVYVLSFDSMPIRTEIGTVDGLKALCALTPPQTPTKAAPAVQAPEEDEHIRRYLAAMDRVQQVRDSIADRNAGLQRLREELKATDDAARQATLRDEILSQEMALPARQKQLKAAQADLQRLEMEFLSEGITLDPDALKAEARRGKDSPAAGGFAFLRHEMGPDLRITVEKPIPTFDYTFKILDVGQFAEDNTLPGGLVYQIQLLAASRKITERELKGLSPVFERRSASGHHVYSVGVFRRYSDALGNLGKVKGRGFKGAMVVAFEDGKQISVPQAREKEAQVRTLFSVRILPEGGQALPEKALDAIHALTDKDITRSAEGASVVFEVGPFSDRADCAVLVSALRECGLGNVSIVESTGTQAR